MKHDWILDVLSDLMTYAQDNGMAAFAEQLNDTKLIVAAEISSLHDAELNMAAGNAGKVGILHRTGGEGKNTG